MKRNMASCSTHVPDPTQFLEFSSKLVLFPNTYETAYSTVI